MVPLFVSPNEVTPVRAHTDHSTVHEFNIDVTGLNSAVIWHMIRFANSQPGCDGVRVFIGNQEWLSPQYLTNERAVAALTSMIKLFDLKLNLE